MSIAQGKKRILITLPEEKIREFKVKAAQADITLSEYISRAGTVTQLNQVVTQGPINSLAGTPAQKMLKGITYNIGENEK